MENKEKQEQKEQKEQSIIEKKDLFSQILLIKRICIFLTVGMIGGFCFVWSEFSDIKQTLDNQTNIINSNFASAINSSFSGFGTQLHSYLAEENSIISSYCITGQGFDPVSKTVDFLIESRPKEYQDGMTTSYVLKCDEETKIIPAVLTDSLSFKANTLIPLCEELKISIIFNKGNLKFSEDLESIALKSEYMLDISSHFEGSYDYFINKNQMEIKGIVRVYDNQINKNNYIVSGTVRVDKNGIMQTKNVMDFTFEPESMEKRIEAYIEVEEAYIEVENGDILSVITETKDKYGFIYSVTALKLRVEGKEIIVIEDPFENPKTE